ncbi:Sucrose operon repressor ScrR, LacI family [Lachnospiraceae bacterium TWA4]|nr:Sucrose operon repressor ScrR, LacI family [Lachnospiraceae bacterium TWA4]
MTISEIAKLANVSSAAVSRYLNGGSLSKEKREIIKKVIEENNYIPSVSARTLRTKRSKQIGVIVPKINSESVPRVVSGISSVLNEAGYQFLLADTNSSLEKEIEYLETINNSQMDGVIFLGSVITKKHREILEQITKPIVIVGQKVSKYACVYHDDKNAAYDATKLLLEAGCKNLGYMGVNQKDKAAGKQRTEGMEKALLEYAIDTQSVSTVTCGFSIQSGYDNVKDLLQKDPTIDGIFCATDAIAIGSLMYLKEIGKKVPEELKICGIGDNQISQIITPKLTTIKYSYKTSGIEAANLLLSMIEKPDTPTKQLLLGYEVINRETINPEMI